MAANPDFAPCQVQVYGTTQIESAQFDSYKDREFQITAQSRLQSIGQSLVIVAGIALHIEIHAK
jgi:hypothetical protein